MFYRRPHTVHPPDARRLSAPPPLDLGNPSARSRAAICHDPRMMNL
ncbi:hypothetical protein CPAR01_09856 [Colletotrichum paranaense]|uniref:Uncharacterized protein n=5 Tax=Colletotrichum acutatum species complex TaxID=2707335 RepID=A0A9Q8WHK4_9PEZI|nr:uncharacterized protein CLUP02_09414 [Colletotrichum lupini]XP_060306822.1 uncharacterized protein CCOS01_14193 [Colletotrichum costaricense]XP_060346302.1 uncharacterized protein CPAR01_09856 [Colletotrichum paranaense]XP_060377616.1 uncharacterized protein CTAM01_11702 [Colletotrichum tamarilloi]KAI3530320.1 hypothetical protein CSPX01_14902 [Colletotrichum filicis]KAK1458281.1 hypothetical protein CMEL01_15628 [Colletotrichum melonis]KAK1487669.1 hypothetical protein CTAM01_11702 [Colle